MSFVDQALSLINKTEANLRRIDAFGEDFATPVRTMGVFGTAR